MKTTRFTIIPALRSFRAALAMAALIVAGLALPLLLLVLPAGFLAATVFAGAGCLLLGFLFADLFRAPVPSYRLPVTPGSQSIETTTTRLFPERLAA